MVSDLGSRYSIRPHEPIDIRGGSFSANAGNNNLEIEVPEGEAWELLHAVCNNNDKVVDTDITGQWSARKQAEKGARIYLTINWNNSTVSTEARCLYDKGQVVLPEGSILRFNWYGCDAGDDLLYAYNVLIWQALEFMQPVAPSPIVEPKPDIQEPILEKKDPKM